MPEEVIITPSTPESSNDENQADNSQINPSNDWSKEPKTKSSKFAFLKNKKFLIIALALILIGGGTVGAILITNKKSPDSNKVSSNTGKTSTNKVLSEEIDATYLDEAKPLEPIEFFKDYKYFGTVDFCDATTNTNCKARVGLKDLKYNQIASTKDNLKVVNVNYSTGFPGDYDYDLTFLEKSGGKYDLIATAASNNEGLSDKSNKSHKSAIDELKKALNTNVQIDETSTLPAIEFPETVEINGQKLKIPDYKTRKPYLLLNSLSSIRGSYFGAVDTKLVKKFGNDKDKTFYIVSAKDTPTYTINETYGTFNKLFAIIYEQDGEVASQKKSVAYNWKSGDKNNSIYYSVGSGCGVSLGYIAAKNIVKTDLIEVGTTAGNQKLYQLPTTSALFTELYGEDYNKGTDLSDASLKNLSKDDFSSKHAYMLVENGLGEFVLFLRSDMFVRGGCGKPVIYLYPKSETKVSVSVGADVKISEPFYPKGGWKNVNAKPDGQLSYLGKIYGSLFWEGTGNGRYPEITSGTIVKKENAIATIKEQLIQQGLQGKEITEFIDFWAPNLPNKPYIRLTWFGNSQLNELAPLNVSPKPDTVIRTFLDFEGLDKPINIPAQRFSAPKRNGFTLVEWGGLARSGLDKLVK